jgi:predicted MPP superfamily phosphohydrolase
MKIAVYSDLHLEFQDWAPPADLQVDVVVLAGDIYPGEEGVEWAKKSFDRPVIYVAGNHDYWNGKDYRYTLEKLRKVAEGSHVHFLHNDAVVIDGWRFVGSTLWTDFKLNGQQPLSMLDARQMMNDFKNIRGPGFRRLQPTGCAPARSLW